MQWHNHILFNWIIFRAVHIGGAPLVIWVEACVSLWFVRGIQFKQCWEERKEEKNTHTHEKCPSLDNLALFKSVRFAVCFTNNFQLLQRFVSSLCSLLLEICLLESYLYVFMLSSIGDGWLSLRLILCIHLSLFFLQFSSLLFSLFFSIHSHLPHLSSLCRECYDALSDQ